MRTVYPHYGGLHPETAALCNLLEAAGALAPHTGEPYTEAMLLGLGGGVGAGYFDFAFAGRRCLRLGLRHRWEDSFRFVQDVLARLGARATVLEAHGPAGAEKSLARLLDAGRPAMAWVDGARLPYGSASQVVVVTRLTHDEALVDDLADEPFHVSPAGLSEARNAVAAHKNRLLGLEAIDQAEAGLEDAVVAAIRACVDRLLRPPVPELGLPALDLWAAGLPAWPARFDLTGALAQVWQAVEGATGGGAFRRLYAAFLEEAAEVAGLPALADSADEYRRLAGAWSRLAKTARGEGPAQAAAGLAQGALLRSLQEQVLHLHAAERRAALSLEAAVSGATEGSIWLA